MQPVTNSNRQVQATSIFDFLISSLSTCLPSLLQPCMYNHKFQYHIPSSNSFGFFCQFSFNVLSYFSLHTVLGIPILNLKLLSHIPQKDAVLNILLILCSIFIICYFGDEKYPIIQSKCQLTFVDHFLFIQ